MLSSFFLRHNAYLLLDGKSIERMDFKMDNSTLNTQFAVTNGLPLGMTIGPDLESHVIDTAGDGRMTEYEKEQSLVQGTREDAEVRREKMEAEDMRIK